MKDWYGNEYVKSSWTRFVFLWQCIGFAARREEAFRVWLENTAARMREIFKASITLNIIESGPYGGDEQRGVIAAPTLHPGKMAPVTIRYYDDITKSGLDPALFVMALLMAYSPEQGDPTEID